MKEDLTIADLVPTYRSTGLLKWRKFLNSFRFATAGFFHVLRTEQNMRVHFVISFAVVCAGFFFEVPASEWCLLIICMALVMAAECVNSGLERLSDRVSREEHYLIKAAKDAAAASVLVLSVAAAIIGLIIFMPKALQWIYTL